MKRIDGERALPYLVESLSSREPLVLEACASLLGSIGSPALEPVTLSLEVEDRVEGALLALERLPLPPAESLLAFARRSVSRAEEYPAPLRAVRAQDGNEAMRLLAEALHHQSHLHGIRALRAIANTALYQAKNFSARAGTFFPISPNRARSWR